jgi:hypothetical protein
MRKAKGETSNSFSVGIASSAFAACAMVAWSVCTAVLLLSTAELARSAWLVCAERATEKNRNIEMEFFDLPNSRQRL